MEVYNVDKNIGTKFQVVTYCILVQVWFHGKRQSVRCCIVEADIMGDMELAISSKFKVRSFKEKLIFINQILHYLTCLLFLWHNWINLAAMFQPQDFVKTKRLRGWTHIPYYIFPGVQ